MEQLKEEKEQLIVEWSIKLSEQEEYYLKKLEELKNNNNMNDELSSQHAEMNKQLQTPPTNHTTTARVTTTAYPPKVPTQRIHANYGTITAPEELHFICHWKGL